MRKLRYLRPAGIYLAAGLLILAVLARAKVMSIGEASRPVGGAKPAAAPHVGPSASLGEEGLLVHGVKPAAASHVGPGGSLETATFGAGCFWCVEATFQRLKGVKSVVSGYSGGQVENPTYAQVCAGNTGHAEVVQVTFDPTRISFDELLEVFWGTHEPTTPNRQGNDVGTQYRSAIFYHGDEQRKLAEHFKQKLDASGAFGAPIVTEILPFRAFFPAENYHQDYYELNARHPYCQFVIRPKVEQLKKVFGDKLKDQAHAPAGGTKR
jgi:peptide-methionine (S)-S-oxide reductase